MKKNTPLDYAEFVLTHSRSRCELRICANGVQEKLASGFLKPFITHLREAEVQVAKGNQIIRLDPPSTFLKKNKVTWFTKGTLERFVRFVSTPEVLERVKGIDDELSQLEHVRIALSKASLQPEDPFYFNDTSSLGVCQIGGSGSLKTRRKAGGNEDDISKNELLKAMDVRILALRDEQRDAFARAIAAGFDNSNMADVLDFSEHFGADRLREACVQFIGLFRGRNIARETAAVESPSADATSSGSDMSLESSTDAELPADLGEHVEEEWAVRNVITDCAEKPVMKNESKILESIPSARTRSRWGPPERLQINQVNPELQDFKIFRKDGDAKQQSGRYNHQEDIRASHADEEFRTISDLNDQPNMPPLTEHSVFFQNGGNVLQETQQGGANSDMFFGRLQKTAKQVKASCLSDDVRMRGTFRDGSAELGGSQLCVREHLHSLKDSDIRSAEKSPCNSPASLVSVSCAVQPSKHEIKLLSGQSSAVMKGFALDETDATARRNSSVKSCAEQNAIQNVGMNRKADLEDSDSLRLTIGESNKLKEEHEVPVSTSTRRLSVQAAISLFESKKVTVEEPSRRKPARQDSQKAAVQSSTSAFEKSILCRGSETNSDSTDDRQDNAEGQVQKQQENVIVINQAAKMSKVVAEQKSIMSIKPIQSASGVGSTHPGHLGLPEYSTEVTLLKQLPSQSQQLVSEISLEVPAELLSEQSNQELVNSTSSKSKLKNLRTSIILPSKPLADTLKNAEINNMAPETEHRDMVTAPVGMQEPKIQLAKDLKKGSTVQNLSITETQTKRLSNYEEDQLTDNLAENLNIASPKHKRGKSRLTESNSHSQIISKADKKPSLILHDTPVDLHMQALVMMIDNHHQNTLSSSNEECLRQHRGRSYDRYWELRNARQMRENPAKRAEREAKLKSMQEVLERRKAEMEARFRQMKKNQFDMDHECSTESGKFMPKASSASREMGEDEVADKQYRLVSASSHAQSTPKSMVQPARHVASKLQMDGTTSRSLLSSPAVQPSLAKSETGTPALVNNQPKMARSIDNRPVGSPIHRTLPDVVPTENVHNSSTVCSKPAGKSVLKMTRQPHLQLANSANFPVVESSIATDTYQRTADVDLSYSSSDTLEGRKDSDCAAYVCGKSSLAQSSTSTMSQDNDKFTEAQIDLGKKHRISDHKCSSGNSNKQSHLISNEKSLEACTGGRTLDNSYINSDNFRPNADESFSSIQNPLVFLDMESARHLAPDTLISEQAPFADNVDKEKNEKNLHEDQAGPLFNMLEEEKSSFILAEKSAELSQSSTVCSPSLMQECNNYDLTSSPANTLKEAFVARQATSSPILSPLIYSPSGSPVAWTYSKAKHYLEYEKNSNVSQSSKEPVRGFRRLLQFGRKKRTSEPSSLDGTSVSAPSEGDDETEGLPNSMGRTPIEFLQRAKSQEKGMHVKNIKDFTGFPYLVATRSLQSNIPIPPSNFNQSDDCFVGGPSLKASRPFFSLSNFRSRGGEGKSR